MPSIFDRVKKAQQIEQIEGGYNFNPNDPGGETKYGISKRQYPGVDIKNLTMDEALNIYTRDYWDFYNFATIDNQKVADKIFFIFINMSPINAANIVQRALNACLVYIEVDGVLGPKTIAGINAIPSWRWLLDRIRIECCLFYVGTISKNPGLLADLPGLINRGCG